MRPGLLQDYTEGADGLFRRRIQYSNHVDIVCADPHGRQCKIEHITIKNGIPWCTTIIPNPISHPDLAPA
jgi:hypothetical protein